MREIVVVYEPYEWQKQKVNEIHFMLATIVGLISGLLFSFFIMNNFIGIIISFTLLLINYILICKEKRRVYIK